MVYAVKNALLQFDLASSILDPELIPTHPKLLCYWMQIDGRDIQLALLYVTYTDGI